MHRTHTLIALTLLNISTVFAQSSPEMATLRSELETIYYDDQSGRRNLKNLAPSSQEFRNLWEKIEKKDSANLIKVAAVLGKYGWLGTDQVGKIGNSALFLVIQHADLAAQTKYLPLLEAAVKAGKASLPNFALLKDRILVRSGARQIYGSQIGQNIKTGLKYVLPIEDVENVDKRRAEVGLPPMATYLRNFNMSWSVMQYQSDLAANKPEGAAAVKPLFSPFSPIHRPNPGW